MKQYHACHCGNDVQSMWLNYDRCDMGELKAVSSCLRCEDTYWVWVQEPKANPEDFGKRWRCKCGGAATRHYNNESKKTIMECVSCGAEYDLFDQARILLNREDTK